MFWGSKLIYLRYTLLLFILRSTFAYIGNNLLYESNCCKFCYKGRDCYLGWIVLANNHICISLQPYMSCPRYSWLFSWLDHRICMLMIGILVTLGLNLSIMICFLLGPTQVTFYFETSICFNVNTLAFIKYVSFCRICTGLVSLTPQNASLGAWCWYNCCSLDIRYAFIFMC
jgi:hypothetical protein